MIKTSRVETKSPPTKSQQHHTPFFAHLSSVSVKMFDLSGTRHLLLHGGQLELGFQRLHHTDVKRILMKLGTQPPPEKIQPPRKCRKLSHSQTLESEVIRYTSTECSVWRINLGCNDLGDKMTEYLHLLPETVTDLDISACGLTTQGIRNICRFMSTNKHILRLIMWGNNINDDGAVYVGEMLKKNVTLKELVIFNNHIGIASNGLIKADPLTSKGKLCIAEALRYNSTLQMIAIDCPRLHSCKNFYSDPSLGLTLPPFDPEVGKAFRNAIEESNSAIESIQIGNITEDPDFYQWETTLQKCESLHSLGSECNIMKANKKISTLRALNALNARKVTREGNEDVFVSTVSTAVHYGIVDAVYYLLRNNVGYIDSKSKELGPASNK